MSHFIHPTALFRLSVLGPLASRSCFQHGELKTIVKEIASNRHDIPNARRTHLSEETIRRWYYAWKQGGVEGLNPKERSNKGKSALSELIKERLKALKTDNASRSINTMIDMIEQEGLVSKGTLSRASVHRFLKNISLSKRIIGNINTIERRSFVAKHPGDIWQGDVLHGPIIQTAEGLKKTYLVSLMDDASRLITHSAFCMGETALDIEGVLKSALLKRGVPDKLIIDNGPAYRSGSLQKICAHLEIRLVYCRPYEPEGKGKLERFHRTFREQFLNELDMTKIRDLGDLNARLWAWVESIYHMRIHAALKGQSPIERWRDELIQVRPLSPFFSNKIDDIFYHRCERLVRKDGTIHWDGRIFEVAHTLVGEKVTLVFNPHLKKAMSIEIKEGVSLGDVFEQDLNANLNRKRQRPHPELSSGEPQKEYGVEKAYDAYVDKLSLNEENKAEET